MTQETQKLKWRWTCSRRCLWRWRRGRSWNDTGCAVDAANDAGRAVDAANDTGEAPNDAEHAIDTANDAGEAPNDNGRGQWCWRHFTECRAKTTVFLHFQFSHHTVLPIMHIVFYTKKSNSNSNSNSNFKLSSRRSQDSNEKAEPWSWIRNVMVQKHFFPLVFWFPSLA